MIIRLTTINQVKKFADYVNSFKGEIYVKQGKICVDGSSLMGLFSLNLLEDLELEIAEGEPSAISEFCTKIQELGIIL